MDERVGASLALSVSVGGDLGNLALQERNDTQCFPDICTILSLFGKES